MTRPSKEHRWRRQLGATPEPAEMAQMVNEVNLQGMKNHVEGQESYYKLRNFWGKLLAITLCLSIGFQFWLAYMVGKGRLNFQDYTTFLNIIAGENFIQVIGLSAFVVKYLFPYREQKTSLKSVSDS